MAELMQCRARVSNVSCAAHLGSMAPLHRCSSGHPCGTLSGMMSSSASHRCDSRVSSQDQEAVRRSATHPVSAAGVRNCMKVQVGQVALVSSTSPDTGSRHSALWAQCHGQKQSRTCPGKAGTRVSTTNTPSMSQCCKRLAHERRGGHGMGPGSPTATGVSAPRKPGCRRTSRSRGPWSAAGRLVAAR